MVDRETVTKHWATALFLIVLVIAAFTAHAGALTISSGDKVEVATKDLKDATTWAKVETGDIQSTSLFGAVTVKLKLTGATEKEQVEPVVQVQRDSSVVVKGNYEGNEVDYVQVEKGRIEGYYSYGKSNTYPWGIYWCVNDINGKPVLVYAEFSKRSTYYIPISYDSVAELRGLIEKGEIPSLVSIQKVAGI